MPPKKKSPWEHLPEARPGHQDTGGKQSIYEGSDITLFARQAVGSTDAVCKWMISDGSKGTTDVEEPCELPSRMKVTLEDVPDTEASYSYKYRISVNGLKQPGFAEYQVWPQKLALEFKYKTQDGDTSGLSDGDAVVGMEFWVMQGGEKSRKWTTEDGGACEASVKLGLDAEILPVSPWEVITPEDQADMPRKRSYEVSKRSWTAKLRSHDGLGTADTDTDRLKQYVNVAEDFSTHCGSLMKLLVGPDTLTDAKKDQKVYIKVTLPAANSMRRDPLPGLWKGADSSTACEPSSGPKVPDGNADRVFEEEFKILNDGEAVELYIQVGYAGGDKAKIEVGATPNYGDHTVHVQNWRKLKVDMFHGNPAGGASQVSTHSVLRADAAAGFEDAQKTILETEFKKMFIEFSEDRKLFYDPADVGNADAQRARIVDGAFLGTTGKVVITPWWPVLHQLSQSKRSPAGPDTWWCAWVDYIADEFSQTVNYATFHSANTSNTFTYNGPGGFFKWDPNTTSLSVTKIVWRANKYVDTDNALKDITTASVDPTFEAKRVGLAADHTLNGPAEATIDDYVEFIEWKKFKLKAPAAILTEGPVRLQVEVTVTFGRLAKFVTNGCAIGGNLWMCTYKGDYQDNGLMGVVLHEMGHNMGMAYGLKGISSVKKASQLIDRADKVKQEVGSMFAVGGRSSDSKIPGIDFPEKVPSGYYYLGRGHTGGHCAHGISDGDRKKESYQGVAGADCIMYGASNMNDNTARAFCDDCIKYTKGTDVRDITKDW